MKKTVLSAYGNVRSTGIIAINIETGDELIDVQITDGTNDVVLATRHGMSIRFHEKDARDMGRTTTGVRGIELEDGDAVIGMVVIKRAASQAIYIKTRIGRAGVTEDITGDELDILGGGFLRINLVSGGNPDTADDPVPGLLGYPYRPEPPSFPTSA